MFDSSIHDSGRGVGGAKLMANFDAGILGGERGLGVGVRNSGVEAGY